MELTDDLKLTIWAAGVFDGEGACLIERVGTYRDSFQIVVSVTNTDVRIINPIKARWGGDNRQPRHLPSGKMNYALYFNHDESTAFLSDILPYVVSKQERIAVVLDALSKIPGEAFLASQGYTRIPPSYRIKEILAPYYNHLKTLP